jgi:hypothetical protein
MKNIKMLIAGLVFLAPILAYADVASTGQAIAAALNKHDIEAMMRLIDDKAVIRLALKDLDLNERDREGVTKGLTKSLRTNMEIGIRSIENVKGSAKFLRSGKNGVKNFALLRYDLGDQGTEYVEYYVNAIGRVEDWYVHSMATLYSTSVSLSLSTVLKTDSMLFGIFGSRLSSDADLKPFTELRTHLQSQNYAAAYKTLESFPEGFRKSRQWALMRVQFAGRIDDATHRTALRYLAQNFGADTDLQFMLTDHYIFEKQYDRALASIAALERAIGGEDGATAFLRGSILIAAKRFDEAATACRRGIALEADYKSGYWCLVTVGTSTKNGKIAVEGLQSYEKAFNKRFDLVQLGALDAYKEIARTPEFVAWKKSR